MTTIKDIQNEIRQSDLKKYFILEMVAEASYQREEKGLTQGELSKMSGIPEKTINRIESGMEVATFDVIGKLLEALGCVPKITFDYE